jgi:hypothetical protein
MGDRVWLNLMSKDVQGVTFRGVSARLEAHMGDQDDFNLSK